VAAAMQRHYPQEELPDCIEAAEKHAMV